MGPSPSVSAPPFVPLWARSGTMNAIRIRKQIDSDTLHLPELRGLIGHEVEIIVLDERSNGDAAAAPPQPGPEPASIMDMVKEAFADVPPEDVARLPTDGAAEHDHYIYGT